VTVDDASREQGRTEIRARKRGLTEGKETKAGLQQGKGRTNKRKREGGGGGDRMQGRRNGHELATWNGEKNRNASFQQSCWGAESQVDRGGKGKRNGRTSKRMAWRLSGVEPRDSASIE